MAEEHLSLGMDMRWTLFASKQNIDDSLTTVARFKANLRPSSWELSPEPATFATSNRWSNKDMDPGECSPARRVSR